jgi:hypothetical protein
LWAKLETAPQKARVGTTPVPFRDGIGFFSAHFGNGSFPFWHSVVSLAYWLSLFKRRKLGNSFLLMSLLRTFSTGCGRL